MKEERFLHLIRQKTFLLSFLTGLVFLAGSFVVNYFAASYATSRASDSVTDIVLSNTRVYDVDAIFVFGALFMVAVIAVVCFYKPRSAPFTVKSIALFIFIRAIFISLTHIRAFPVRALIDYNFLNASTFWNGIFTGNDLFFSGHTGLPFLMALIWWKNRFLRTLFLMFSLLFGVVVLLGHLHYTIDVLSAFFITFSIWSIAKVFFKKDWKFFLNDNPSLID
jgi:hypothetical protein